MLYTDTEALKERINKLYTDKEPFFFVVNYEKTEGILVENPLNQQDIYFKFPKGENKPFPPTKDKRIDFKVLANSLDSYKQKFDELQRHMQNGKISFANLTERTKIEMNLSLQEVFSLSESLYQIYLPERFVCFSPEIFVRISGERISTNPMKGTIDADLPNAERLVLDNPKELAEHTATVELMSKELAQVSDLVEVVRFRYIDRLKTNRKALLQVSSEIAGTLKDDYKKRIGDALFSLLPGTSIAGEPKEYSLRVLQEIERIERGYYCGIAGYFDGETLDSAVLIRFIEQHGKDFYFRSGGGITRKSVCENEYQEVLDKVYLPFV